MPTPVYNANCEPVYCPDCTPKYVPELCVDPDADAAGTVSLQYKSIVSGGLLISGVLRWTVSLTPPTVNGWRVSRFFVRFGGTWHANGAGSEERQVFFSGNQQFDSPAYSSQGDIPPSVEIDSAVLSDTYGDQTVGVLWQLVDEETGSKICNLYSAEATYTICGATTNLGVEYAETINFFMRIRDAAIAAWLASLPAFVTATTSYNSSTFPCGGCSGTFAVPFFQLANQGAQYRLNSENGPVPEGLGIVIFFRRRVWGDSINVSLGTGSSQATYTPPTGSQTFRIFGRESDNAAAGPCVLDFSSSDVSSGQGFTQFDVTL